MRASVRWTFHRLGGHRLRYAVSGDGPVVVVPRKDRGAYRPVDVLAATYRVLQVEPIGFGGSDRPERYPEVGVADQILAVCEAERVDEFAVWGYSQGGAMACALARATTRVRAVVCGGFNPLRPPSPAWVARMNRERRVPPGSRAFWNDFTRYDWHHELRRLATPVLVYAGTHDRQHPRPRDQLVLRGLGVDMIDFAGLDHGSCGLTSATGPATEVVIDWLRRRPWSG